MENATLALLAGLVGSILTVLITKLFDLYQKRYEHKSELKREYFNKKINSLERASIQLSLTVSAIGNLSKIINVFKDVPSSILCYNVATIKQR